VSFPVKMVVSVYQELLQAKSFVFTVYYICPQDHCVSTIGIGLKPEGTTVKQVLEEAGYIFADYHPLYPHRPTAMGFLNAEGHLDFLPPSMEVAAAERLRLKDLDIDPDIEDGVAFCDWRMSFPPLEPPPAAA